MIKRIAAITLVFGFTAVAWFILGATVSVRTASQDGTLKREVGQLWGVPQRQRAPTVHRVAKAPEERPGARGRAASRTARGAASTQPATPVQPAASVQTIAPSQIPPSAAPPQVVAGGATAQTALPSPATAQSSAGTFDPVPLDASTIDVDLSLDHRRKGLLWYSTYRVRFTGEYRIANDTDEPQDYRVSFVFPTEGAIYDNFSFAVGGREVEDLQVTASTITGAVRLEPGASETVRVAYGSQGLDEWWYDFGANVSQMRDFSLTMRTDFEEIDFPQNSISPTEKTRAGNGWELRWEYSNLLSGVQIGMRTPQKLNPGPWVSQITFFAPVSLFLFFFLLFIFTTIKRVRIHPMNYFFIGTGFFAFHLLLAYLVDHVSIHVAFAICSAVSLFLVISYMRLVVGSRFAILQVGVSQFVYLVLFSYTFFFERYTGLAVTILCVVTLFVVMQMTGRVDWERLTSGAPPPEAAPAPQPQPTVTGEG